jgi:hypothetical protein
MKRWILWIGRLFILIVYAILLAYAVIVGMAFVLKLLGANPTADFADWVYRASANIIEPFRGIFPTKPVGENGTSVFDASLVFALLVYLVLAVVLHGVISWLTRQISGIDRAEEAQRQQAALEAQRESALAALGVGPVVTTPPPEETTTIGWDQPAPGAVAAPWPPEALPVQPGERPSPTSPASSAIP